MSVTATYPAKRSQHIQIAYWVAAAIILMVTMYELFKYENVPGMLVEHLPADTPVELVAALAVTVQVFALPHLLGMKISKLMRFFSISCCIISCVTVPLGLALLVLG